MLGVPCLHDTIDYNHTIQCESHRAIYKERITDANESTAGADASVEVPKLHNIKLLIASFYTHIDYNYHDENFYFCCIGNSNSG